MGIYPLNPCAQDLHFDPSVVYTADREHSREYDAHEQASNGGVTEDAMEEEAT